MNKYNNTKVAASRGGGHQYSNGSDARGGPDPGTIRGDARVVLRPLRVRSGVVSGRAHADLLTVEDLGPAGIPVPGRAVDAAAGDRRAVEGVPAGSGHPHVGGLQDRRRPALVQGASPPEDLV